MEEIFKKLELDVRLIELSNGSIPLLTPYDMFSYYSLEDKKDTFPHPPFMLPIMVSYDADHYHIGLVKHWFTDRSITFGDMTDAKAFSTAEISRNLTQFFDKLLFEAFVSNDCIIDDRMKTCCERLDIKIETLELFKEINGRNENYDYCALPSFETQIPLECYPDNYDGDFPSSERNIIATNIKSACYCEIDHKEWIGYPQKNEGFSFFKKKSRFEEVTDVPEWLKPETNKKDLFDLYIQDQKFDQAWLIINGPGFTPIEVGKRLQLLKNYTNEEAFHLWVDYWCDKYGDVDDFIFM